MAETHIRLIEAVYKTIQKVFLSKERAWIIQIPARSCLS